MPNFKYDDYVNICEQYMSDYFNDEAAKEAKYYYGEDTKIKELAMSEINMETPIGYYVDM